MAGDREIGGYSLDQLFGLEPVDKTKREKRIAEGRRSPAGTAAVAPFKLLGALARAPFVIAARLGSGLVGALGEILRLPGRAIGAIVRPWRR